MRSTNKIFFCVPVLFVIFGLFANEAAVADFKRQTSVAKTRVKRKPTATRNCCASCPSERATVSHDFRMGDWQPEKSVRVPWMNLYRTIHVWTVPKNRRVPKTKIILQK
jgi:hypothetical protein